MLDELSAKSKENLLVSQWTFSGKHFDACGSRAYYSAMQAARFALERYLGISTDRMSHARVQSQFNEAVYRKRLKVESVLQGQLNILLGLRDIADYGPGRLSEPRARDAVRRAELFGSLLQSEGA